MPTPYEDEGFRWLKIGGAEYPLDKKQVSEWLEFWIDLACVIGDDSESGHMIGNATVKI
jgi:hypothetical protein